MSKISIFSFSEQLRAEKTKKIDSKWLARDLERQRHASTVPGQPRRRTLSAPSISAKKREKTARIFVGLINRRG
jgi:hypothetical protein